jgi:hypothetical protein
VAAGARRPARPQRRRRGRGAGRRPRRAAELGLSTGDRVLSTRDWSGDGLRDGLLAVLAGGASLVQCRNTPEEALAHRAEQERATHRL